MRILKTNLSEESKENWRAELMLSMPVDTHDYIDLGVCDYLFSCVSVEPEDIYRAIEEYKVRRKL